MKRAADREALHGANLLPISLDGKHQARSDRTPTHQDRACTADTNVARNFDAFQPEVFAQEIT
jgi:hypothetical protein